MPRSWRRIMDSEIDIAPALPALGQSLKGGCHCGNISIEMTLTQTAASYIPRACDCDFCRKHSAAYVSDPKGSLSIKVKDNDALGAYRQGEQRSRVSHLPEL